MLVESIVCKIGISFDKLFNMKASIFGLVYLLATSCVVAWHCNKPGTFLN